MPEASQEYTSQIGELRRINHLIEHYKGKLGEFDVVPVADSGFLVQSKRQIPMAGNDWLFFDYDDTLRGTTEVKGKRLTLYKEHARKLDIEASDDLLENVMNATDKFSRWEDVADGGDSYHANAHMVALDWATKQLQTFSERKRKGENIDFDEAEKSIASKLNSIKSELKTEDISLETTHFPDDLFHFHKNPNRLVLRSLTPWSKGIEQIFMQTMINPPDYLETVQAASILGQPKDYIHRLNLGIFTFGGDPYYQLLKVFELMKKNPDLPISQLWLTKVPKGKFIEDMILTGANRKTKLQYVPSVLEEDSMEGISPGSGYPLGETPHIIIMLDDNPKELNSILATNEFLKEKSGASFVVVRSRRSGTREGEKEWDVKTPYGEVDFRRKQFTANEVAAILQINRYLSYKNQYGGDNPTVRSIASDLQKFGIDETQLAAAD